LAEEVGTAKLKEIAQLFRIKNIGSISTTIKKLKDLLEEDKILVQRIEKIINECDT